MSFQQSRLLDKKKEGFIPCQYNVILCYKSSSHSRQEGKELKANANYSPCVEPFNPTEGSTLESKYHQYPKEINMKPDAHHRCYLNMLSPFHKIEHINVAFPLRLR